MSQRIPLTDITITWSEIGPDETTDGQVSGDVLARILGYLDEEGGLDAGGIFWDAKQSAFMLEELGDLLRTMVSHGLEHPGAQAAIV
jgi:hypothetical protein